MRKTQQDKEKRSTLSSLRITMIESSITAGLICMSIMTPFFQSIGLSQADIAITQIAFTVIVSVLNIPTGWIADRFSRKWANIIGDFGTFIVFIAYANVHNIAGAIICESLLGILIAFSQGVDVSLIRHFCYKIITRKSENKGVKEEAEKFFKSKIARLSTAQYACELILVLLGGPIGAISFRLAIALSGVTALIGGVISIFIKDDSEKLKTEEKPLKDMVRIIKNTIKNKPLRNRIFACAVGRQLTHGIIWVVTPMFLFAGVPLPIVSFAWAINSVTCIVGSIIATKYTNKLSERWLFAIPLILATISMGALSISINLFTVCLYFLMGIVQGWTNATLMPMVQRYANPAEQTTIVSMAKVAGQILYIPIVWITGLAADASLNYAPLVTILIFVPMGLLIIKSLNKQTP